jgi:hypothetical protein
MTAHKRVSSMLVNTLLSVKTAILPDNKNGGRFLWITRQSGNWNQTYGKLQIFSDRALN